MRFELPPGLLHPVGHRVERAREQAQLVGPGDVHVRGLAGGDRLGGLAEPAQRRGDLAADRPRAHRADGDEHQRDGRDPLEEATRGGEDAIAGELDYEDPRRTGEDRPACQIPPATRSLVLDDSLAVRHVDRWTRDPTGEVRPDVSRDVADQERGVGADESGEPLSGLWRAQDAAPVDDVARRSLPVSDGPDDREEE